MKAEPGQMFAKVQLGNNFSSCFHFNCLYTYPWGCKIILHFLFNMVNQQKTHTNISINDTFDASLL